MHAGCRSLPTSSSAGSRQRRPAWSVPTSPTSSTRRRCWPPAAPTSSSRSPTSPTRSSGSCSARTAYHEGGHAIVGMLTEGADPVRKVSIIPRGLALGVTFAAPESDRFNYLEPEVRAKIKVSLGGRAAEEVVFGETSTGAESDIQQLTELARQMVGRWGMSPAVGPVAVLPRDGRGPLLPGVAEVSPETQRLVDDEVRRIVDEAHGEVVQLLRENRDKLDSLANALLEHETLDEDDAYAAAGVARTATADSDAYAAAARSRNDR